MKCLGYVFAGIGLTVAAMAAVGGFAIFFVFLAEMTAQHVGVMIAPFWFVLYLCIVAGGIGGAVACKS